MEHENGGFPEIEYTDEFGEWWVTLTGEQQVSITAAVEMLEQHGPSLGRLLVRRIANSWYPQMSALRVPGEKIDVFFAFDPARNVIILLDGDRIGR